MAIHTENLIPADEICERYHVEISFISTLRESGLVEIITLEETEYIPLEQLDQLEKIVRLYYELDINVEGIETIIHLLEKIDEMQEEINELQNRLRLYE
jgi:chaperone modulatory protein CbpM